MAGAEICHKSSNSYSYGVLKRAYFLRKATGRSERDVEARERRGGGRELAVDEDAKARAAELGVALARAVVGDGEVVPMVRLGTRGLCVRPERSGEDEFSQSGQANEGSPQRNATQRNATQRNATAHAASPAPCAKAVGHACGRSK